MALTNNHKLSGKLFILKVKTKDENSNPVPVYIQVTEKVGDKWTVSPNTINSVSGDLIKIEIKEDEYEGNKYKKIGIYLSDKAQNELYLLDLRFNMTSQGIFNNLFSLGSFNDVKIDVYQSKSGFPASAVTQGGNKVSWKFSKEDLPAITKVKVGKKEVIDSSELEEFFLTHLDALAERVNSKKATSSQSAPKTPKAAKDETEDVPF